MSAVWEGGVSLQRPPAIASRRLRPRVCCRSFPMMGIRGAKTPLCFNFCSAPLRPAWPRFVFQPESGALFPTCGFRVPRR